MSTSATSICWSAKASIRTAPTSSALDAAALEAVRAAGQTLQIRVLGLAAIGLDVTPELALATIDSITVLGALHASAAVKTALAGRIR